MYRASRYWGWAVSEVPRAGGSWARGLPTELGMTDEVEHVTDFADIAAYGVMSTPALVVDGKVVHAAAALRRTRRRLGRERPGAGRDS